MKTSSAKAKGRRLQQEVASRIRAAFNLPESDVKSLPMGSQGCDVWLSSSALHYVPLSIECKNTEKINIWQAIKQAETNCLPATSPAVVFARNRQEPYVAVPLSALLSFLKEKYES